MASDPDILVIRDVTEGSEVTVGVGSVNVITTGGGVDGNAAVYVQEDVPEMVSGKPFIWYKLDGEDVELMYFDGVL